MKDSERKTIPQGVEHDEDSCALFPELDGAKLKAYRTAKGMTLEKFANAYGLNVRTLRRWEAQHTTPRYTGVFSKILADWLQWVRETRQHTPANKLS